MFNGIFLNLSRQRYKTQLFQCASSIRNNSQNCLLLKMNEAYLRYIDGSEMFDFTFRYMNPELNFDRKFNVTRKKSESIGNFLRRIDVNVNKHVQEITRRRMKKKKIVYEPVFENNVEMGKIFIERDGSKLTPSNSCSTILENPSMLSINILGTLYTIKYNAPWIVSMKLPKCMLAGFPVYPVEYESLFTSTTKSTFTWWKYELPVKQWKQVGDEYIYIPDTSDIGSRLLLRCLPRNDTLEGPEIEVESQSTVEAGPGKCPFESRHKFTQVKLSGKEFRVTSYNILANTYADSDFSRGVLFPYCPPYALNIDYRKLLIIKELLGYNSDIICLQEVDKKIYKNDLMPALQQSNYAGIFNAKGDLGEGLAVLYNQRRFEFLDSQGVTLSENITGNDVLKSIWDKVTNLKARERFLQKKNTLLIVTLRSLDKPSEILIVGNTHLYFHPNADHIRLLQAFCALSMVQKTAADTREKYPNLNVTLMLCGDFNSTPVDGVYEFMTRNVIPENHQDWRSCEDETIQDVTLTHDLSISSACGTPEYTNYTLEFANCLDYIFFESDKLAVSQIIPMPSTEELSLHGAIPSVVFPSDHIAICADLKWK